FQAEDGIRDGHVTGVQTCALPILRDHRAALLDDGLLAEGGRRLDQSGHLRRGKASVQRRRFAVLSGSGRGFSRSGRVDPVETNRSEERRVGKEWRYRGEPDL